MESGTLLHLALLRKISNQGTHSGFRDKIAASKKKHIFSIIAEDISSHQKEHQKGGPLPLLEKCCNRERNKTTASRLKNKPKVENMTISGWSTQSIELNSSHLQDTQQKGQYQKKGKNGCRKKNAKVVKTRHFSEAHNLKIKSPLPFQLDTFIPDYQFKNKYKTPTIFRPQHYPLKHTSINYDSLEETENRLPDKAGPPEPLLTTKLPSYQAFISEMRQRVKNKKIKL